MNSLKKKKQNILWGKKWRNLIQQKAIKDEMNKQLKVSLEKQKQEEEEKECTFKPQTLWNQSFKKTISFVDEFFVKLKPYIEQQQMYLNHLKDLEVDDQIFAEKIKEELRLMLSKAIDKEIMETIIEGYKGIRTRGMNKMKREKLDILSKMIKLEREYNCFMAKENVDKKDLEECGFDCDLAAKLRNDILKDSLCPNSLRDFAKIRQEINKVLEEELRIRENEKDFVEENVHSNEQIFSYMEKNELLSGNEELNNSVNISSNGDTGKVMENGKSNNDDTNKINEYEQNHYNFINTNNEIGIKDNHNKNMVYMTNEYCLNGQEEKTINNIQTEYKNGHNNINHSENEHVQMHYKNHIHNFPQAPNKNLINNEGKEIKRENVNKNVINSSGNMKIQNNKQNNDWNKNSGIHTKNVYLNENYMNMLNIRNGNEHLSTLKRNPNSMNVIITKNNGINNTNKNNMKYADNSYFGQMNELKYGNKHSGYINGNEKRVEGNTNIDQIQKNQFVNKNYNPVSLNFNQYPNNTQNKNMIKSKQMYIPQNVNKENDIFINDSKLKSPNNINNDIYIRENAQFKNTRYIDKNLYSIKNVNKFYDFYNEQLNNIKGVSTNIPNSDKIIYGLDKYYTNNSNINQTNKVVLSNFNENTILPDNGYFRKTDLDIKKQKIFPNFHYKNN
ncbi:conserved Plasmodium protein, unknown function [Plasmodium berghei]|uniref:Uncharacterized protein n=2 Tax=Plasmodium berghei TaxID=5821 RepID=A0A509ASC8_PLABA|nr:conserved protein, unknown function [Plasmodium berghei ANKA]CXI62507.1 conserved Plasmodium protein, unknown function [Plasmodium berghei]SCM23721.1 conserved Plasmodium protein, unknown function [Plasmodium berghei]SCN26741.1 conserved Plasmodium protein, unknown function [Plasmodium berghei]SCO61057.1 conserved Plasmodium protein, unknown function [Plasmodium berghei]SCO63160.1 conserved Plasmodium protein, unknown function [Plasmodium berghei]|eukprot:XP_034422357.1 conserved protein, unknown function [Plasmodium berghei ANKA]